MITGEGRKVGAPMRRFIVMCGRCQLQTYPDLAAVPVTLTAFLSNLASCGWGQHVPYGWICPKCWKELGSTRERVKSMGG